MDQQEMLSVQGLIENLAPLIDPLHQFETLVDKEEQVRRNCQARKKEVIISKIVVLIIVPIISIIIFYTLNKNIMYNPPSIMKSMIWGILILPDIYFLIYFLPIIKKQKEDIDMEEKQTTFSIKEEEKVIISPYWESIQRNVPPNYQYSMAVNAFCSYFRNGRAYNMKEAVNLYEEEMHRNRMENMQAQVLQQQKYQTTLMAISAAANVATAFNTASAASALNNISER